MAGHMQQQAKSAHACMPRRRLLSSRAAVSYMQVHACHTLTTSLGLQHYCQTQLVKNAWGCGKVWRLSLTIIVSGKDFAMMNIP